MRYILEPWQMHAARDGDVVIMRSVQQFESYGWIVAILRNGRPEDSGLGEFLCIADAESAARDRLGAI